MSTYEIESSVLKDNSELTSDELLRQAKAAFDLPTASSSVLGSATLVRGDSHAAALPPPLQSADLLDRPSADVDSMATSSTTSLPVRLPHSMPAQPAATAPVPGVTSADLVYRPSADVDSLDEPPIGESVGSVLPPLPQTLPAPPLAPRPQSLAPPPMPAAPVGRPAALVVPSSGYAPPAGQAPVSTAPSSGYAPPAAPSPAPRAMYQPPPPGAPPVAYQPAPPTAALRPQPLSFGTRPRKKMNLGALLFAFFVAMFMFRIVSSTGFSESVTSDFLEVGECYTSESLTGYTQLREVGCVGSHDVQIYAQITIAGSAAQGQCESAFFRLYDEAREIDPTVVIPTDATRVLIDNPNPGNTTGGFCMLASPSGGLRGSVMP